MNRPVNFNDPTGHCAICIIALFVVGVVAITSAVDMMETSAMEMNVISHQSGFDEEQITIQHWQDNCMGSCHYASSATPSGSTGPRPQTPLTDQYSSSMANAFLATLQFAGGASSISGIHPSGGNLSDIDARKWYISHELEIPDLVNPELSIEAQARQAFDIRNFYRTEARNLMANRFGIDGAIDLALKEPNMTWEQIIQRKINKGLSGDAIFEDITRSASTSRQSVNAKLGLDNWRNK